MKVTDILNNYDSYYNDLFKDFDINNIDNKLSQYILYDSIFN